MKSPGSTGRGHEKLSDLRAAEEDGIPGVVVKCVDTWRNPSGEGGLLGCYLTLRRESVGSKQD